MKYLNAYLRILLLAFSIIMLSVTITATAQERLIVGPSYEIKELDFLKFIEATLQAKKASGELADIEKNSIAKAKHAIQNPKNLNVPRTATTRTHYFDPTIVANEDFHTPEGVLIVSKGTQVNPLNIVSLSKILLFFDASDAEQVVYAKAFIAKQTVFVKPILSGGSFLSLMKQWKKPVYFDQGSTLIYKLGIQQVPAIVYQEGLRLRIDEVLP